MRVVGHPPILARGRPSGCPGKFIAIDLALLYLSAPALAGQVPELLHPAYRDLLWSWTPIRFAVEGLRSLLFSAGAAPAVAVGLWVFAALAVAGLTILLWPARRTAAAPDAGSPAPVPVG